MTLHQSRFSRLILVPSQLLSLLPLACSSDTAQPEAATASAQGGTGGSDGSSPPPPDDVNTALQGANWPMPNALGLGLPNETSYDLVSEAAAIDLVTGLMWQRRVVDGEFYSSREAQAYCESLELDAHADWRIPSRIELVSILDLTVLNPAIDAAVFPDTPSYWFWSATPRADGTNEAWHVYFYFGYPDLENVDTPFNVRCVRAASDAAVTPSDDRYELREASVFDLRTELLWQRTAPDTLFTFEEARGYCAELSLENSGAWRVPTMKELQTLVDASRANPAIDAVAFADTPNTPFWTATVWAESPLTRAWRVNFDYGSALYLPAEMPFHVRCVQ